MIKRISAYAIRGWDHLVRQIAVQALGGSEVLCPICGWGGKRFLSGGRCPSCQSLSRHRRVPFSFRYFGEFLRRGTVLHIGPNIIEARSVLAELSPTSYYRLDIEERPIINLQADARSIPLADESVDVALAWHVLEHIPDDRKVIAEIHRVLRPSGSLLVSVPVFPIGNEKTIEDQLITRAERLRRYGHDDHVRACGMDYGLRFVECGFSVTTLVMNRIAREELAFFGLSHHHVVWHCVKVQL